MGHTAELARNGQEALEKIVVHAAALFSSLEAEVFPRIAVVRRSCEERPLPSGEGTPAL